MSIAALAAAGPIAQGLFSLVDQLFTSDDERMSAKLKLLELEQSGALAQLAVNAKEAEHSSIFVAGWRPFIGWTCGMSMAWTFVAHPIIQFTLAAFGIIVPLPVPDLTVMLPVLLGMLGLGGMRSWEKAQGVERNTLEPKIDRRGK